MNFILKLAYLYKVTEKKRLIYMHLLLVLCGLPGPQERRKLISRISVYNIKKKKPVYMHNYCYLLLLLYGSVLWLTRPSRQR